MHHWPYICMHIVLTWSVCEYGCMTSPYVYIKDGAHDKSYIKGRVPDAPNHHDRQTNVSENGTGQNNNCVRVKLEHRNVHRNTPKL